MLMGDRPLDLPENVFIGICGSFNDAMLVVTKVTELADPNTVIADRAVVVGRTAHDIFNIAGQFGYQVNQAVAIKFSDLQKHCEKFGIRFLYDGNRSSPILDRMN